MHTIRLVSILSLVIILTLLLSSSAPHAYAMESPNYRMDWLVPLSGGGGVSQSANYAVHLTYGQTAVGSVDSTGYRANLGYWYGVLLDWWMHVRLPIVIR